MSVPAAVSVDVYSRGVKPHVAPDKCHFCRFPGLTRYQSNQIPSTYDVFYDQKGKQHLHNHDQDTTSYQCLCCSKIHTVADVHTCECGWIQYKENTGYHGKKYTYNPKLNMKMSSKSVTTVFK